jgi:hypothetical protein
MDQNMETHPCRRNSELLEAEEAEVLALAEQDKAALEMMSLDFIRVVVG